ncbi:MAG: phosphatase PAP2 family protein, partial [Erysipelotrichia bacterium]|nr:phosphatase PAP2 family protein [Erysipelotrichia bacterium]
MHSIKSHYDQFYELITAWYRRDNKRIKTLKLLNRLNTLIFYWVYPLLLICSFLKHEPAVWKMLLVPAVSFWLLTLIRAKINRSRPYEDWNLDVLISKDKSGESMPSRHIFSAAVISMAVLRVNVPAGIILLFVSLAGGYMRIVGGMHYP